MPSYFADNVGSLLRPPYLLEARERHRTGAMADAEFKRIEDRAVNDAIAIQERAEMDVVSDGEQRRNIFASQLVQATEGFDIVEGNEVDWFRLDGTVEHSPVTVGVVAPIRLKRSLSGEEFAYLRARTDRPTKITLPSPTMYAYYWVPGISESAYPSSDAYFEAVVGILKDEVRELVRLGAEYIQFDAPELGMLIDPHQQQWFAGKGFDPDHLIDQGIDMMNAIMAGHSGVTFGLHVCRGNDANRYMASGGYDRIARRVFGRSHAQRLLLEYDDERSGGFEPLREVPDDTIVVLGLVTTKRAALETARDLRARIDDASRYIPLERLALSPQCGFASVADGNALGFVSQAAKLALVTEVAREVWGERN